LGLEIFLSMKRLASITAEFMARTSVKLGSSNMRTLALTGYALTVFGAKLPRILDKMA
jgi:hypothetical protein